MSCTMYVGVFEYRVPGVIYPAVLQLYLDTKVLGCEGPRTTYDSTTAVQLYYQGDDSTTAVLSRM